MDGQISAMVVEISGQGLGEGLLEERITQASTVILGAGWRLYKDWRRPPSDKVIENIGFILYQDEEQSISPGQAWNQAAKVRAGILKSIDASKFHVSVRPVIGTAPLAPGEASMEDDAKGGIGVWDGWDKGQAGILQDHDWSLKLTNVLEAQELFNVTGKGIRVGLPDTGYTLHNEMTDAPRGRLNYRAGVDCFDGQGLPVDAMKRGFLRFPGHGTGTGSVLMSGVGREIQGTAPKAELIPYRVANTVALFAKHHRDSLARAIREATAAGCDIISISLGWIIAGKNLTTAVKEAIDRGVIVIAAAAQLNLKYPLWLPTIAFPAKCKDVIGVAACDYRGKPAVWSFRGKAVDVTAPGQDVWRAAWKDYDTPHQTPVVAHGSGTSYAAPHVAGIAALWLERWRDELKLVHGPDRARIFKEVLDRCGLESLGPDWGAGLIDAVKALGYDWTKRPYYMPKSLDHEGRSERPELEEFSLTVNELIDGSPPLWKLEDAVQAALLAYFSISADETEVFLQTYGEELTTHLFTAPQASARFVQSVERVLGTGEVFTLEKGVEDVFLPDASNSLMSFLR